MTNIPTDLLRTLVAVVDLRSFTKAAAKLGVTQPAVSAQIKRLQFLLGGELFDRSVQGISLTPQGELVVSYARRLLSINDQIVSISDNGPRPELVIRVGTPSEYIASILPGILAQFRARWPDVRFNIRTDFYDPLARELRGGDIDLMIGLSMKPPHDARHSRAQEVVWVHSAGNPHRPRSAGAAGILWRGLRVSPARGAGIAVGRPRTGKTFSPVRACPVCAARSTPASASWRSPAGGR